MTSQDPTTETDPQSEGPQGLREHVGRLETELEGERATAQELLRENVAFKVSAAGLNPEQGIGKSIVKDIHRGDYDGEITPTALAAYASAEYGEEIEVTEDPTPDETDEAKDLAETQGQIDEIQTAGSSQPVSVIPKVDIIDQLQTEMLRPDATPEEVSRAVQSSITAKAQKLRKDWKEGRIHTTPEP